MRSFFLDTNIVLDFYADRKPFSEDAAKIFTLAAKGKLRLYISALTFSNIYYILKRQSHKHAAVLKILYKLSEISEIIDLSGDIVLKSFQTDFNDFEDALQYNCALSVKNIEFIITRNGKDFKHSKLPVVSPNEALALMKI